MTCTVCSTNQNVKKYFVTGVFMNDRILYYCETCAERVTKILPHVFSGPGIKLQECEF